ncbi:MAG: hypothetical protein QGG55_09440, partial [Verrucomicrobiota bacterium]|nr:hypothetical protein [Verrucomicrobiota bacterium]
RRKLKSAGGCVASQYKAIIFNPVPGPPMGPNTHLSFCHLLKGADMLRVQIYGLIKNYHPHLTLVDLLQGKWKTATADMLQARRPEGTGGPLAEGERIDNIQFYIPFPAELHIDDIVLYEAAA